MRKKELIDEIAKKEGMLKVDVEKVLRGFAEVVEEELKKGGEVPFMHLGKLVVMQMRERKGRNPVTKEIIKIPARKVVRFKMSKRLKEVLNG